MSAPSVSDGLPASRAGWHRRIWSLSWPVIVSNVSIPLVGVVDTAVMGRQPEPAYVGAVALGAAVFSTFYWIFGFLRMGTTGLAAQRFGARDADGIAAVVLRGFAIAVLLGAGMVALQRPILEVALWTIEGSARVEHLLADYFELRIWGAPALLVHLVELGLLFALQRMRAVLALTLVFNLLNVALDVTLVMGFGMGVAGVALGTLISEWVAAVLGLAFVAQAIRATGGRLARWRDLRSPAALAALLRLNTDLLVRTLFVQLPFLVTAVVGASLGDVVLAANAVLMQCFMVMMYALDGFAHAAEALAGYACGARDGRSLRDTLRYSSLWAGLLAVGLALLVLLAGETFVASLTDLRDVRDTASSYLGWVAALPLVAVWAFQFDGIYIGATASRTLRNQMFLAALLYLAVLIPLFAVWGNHALWLAMFAFMLSRGALLAWRYPALERRVASA